MKVLEQLFDAIDTRMAARDWAGLAEDFARLSGSNIAAAYSVTLKPEQAPKIDVLACTNPAFAEEYVAGEAYRMSVIDEFSLPDMRARRSSDMISDEMMLELPYYKKFSAKYDVHYLMAVTTLLSPQCSFNIALSRPKGWGDFEDEQLMRFSLAIRYLRIFAKTEYASDTLHDSDLVAAFSGPAAIVGPQRELIKMNADFEAASEQIFRALPKAGGKMAVGPSLLQKIESAVAVIEPEGAGKTEVGLGDAGQLQIVRLAPAANGEERWLWLIFPNADENVRLARFQSEAGLTDTEAEVMRHLAHGLSLRDIARVSGRGYGTVRWHVQNMLEKVGAHSQQDLLARFYLEVSPW